jgi:hypothetical protein
MVVVGWLSAAAATLLGAEQPVLIPYPKQITFAAGSLALGPARFVAERAPTETEQIARQSLTAYLPRQGTAVAVRLGSLEEGCPNDWLSASDRDFLANPQASPEASVVTIGGEGITVVGKGRWGMLYGVQTVNQLIRGTDMGQGMRRLRTELPHVTIRDWPDMRWRCLSPQMTWYSGYNRLEGYDNGNWTLDEWKWLVDWSLLHKCNGWALCMYGNWPFTLPGYAETTLDVDSFFWNPATGRKEPHRFTHRNIRREFLPELIRYANQRGLKIYAYIGKNTFNGTYGLKHPEANAGGAAELIPFHAGVHEYWEAFIRRIVELGFNGFVFEDPEALHVPNQNAECYRTFWAPWAGRYGFTSVAQTDQNNPPLGVHVEYYTWLFRTFDALIQKHAAARGRELEIYLISHILLSRMVSESKTQAERDEWFALIDRKQGRKVPFVILEADEEKYVSFLGGDRVASLGGRGGSCTNAMRRIASINNNWCGGGMGGDLAYERQCQKRIYQAGGFGAMGYIFEWTNTEPFGYLAAQYLWHNGGVPGIDNDSQTGFLGYCCRAYYGDAVGALVARTLDEGSCVNDAMMLEGVYGSQYPSTGAPLHRDYQYLAVQADRAVELARRAFQLHAGREPDLEHPVYQPEAFRWNGYAPAAERDFLAERLRLLYVSARRSQAMCDAVLAQRLARRLIAGGASAGAVSDAYDRALAAARDNQRIYQINYDDDYDWTDGLCSRVTEAIQSQRDQFVASISGRTEVRREWTFASQGAGARSGWTEVHDTGPPAVEQQMLTIRAVGQDPFVIQREVLATPVDSRCYLELEMRSDQGGRLRVFWATAADLASLPAGAYPFSEARVRNAEVLASESSRVYRVTPDWNGTLARLRIDIPPKSTVRLRSIRVLRMPEALRLSEAERARPVPETLRRSVVGMLSIPWERQAPCVPDAPVAHKPGLYLSTDIGCDQRADFYRLGVVFSIDRQQSGGDWQTVFRNDVPRRASTWQHWDIPLGVVAAEAPLNLRFVTDSYSRAQDRGAPSWRWALWGQPQIVEITAEGRRLVRYDFAAHLDRARPMVRLDADGRIRPFDHPGKDSTGAVFALADPGIARRYLAAEGTGRQWVDGFAAWRETPPQRGPYRGYLGTVDSGWVYSHQNGRVAWRTAPVPDKKPTAVAFVGGTGYAPGQAELACDGRRLLRFDMAVPRDGRWSEGDVQLRYLHGGDTRSATIPYGISGVYVLLLPASMVTAGKPLELSVHVPPNGGGDWFMVHEYRDVLEATADVVSPRPRAPADLAHQAAPALPAMPVIAAFTPHLDGQFGVTIAEFSVDLAPGGTTPADSQR